MYVLSSMSAFGSHLRVLIPRIIVSILSRSEVPQSKRQAQYTSAKMIAFESCCTVQKIKYKYIHTKFISNVKLKHCASFSCQNISLCAVRT